LGLITENSAKKIPLGKLCMKNSTRKILLERSRSELNHGKFHMENSAQKKIYFRVDKA